MREQPVARGDLLAREAEAVGDLSADMGHVAGGRIDMDGDDLLRGLGGDLLDVHAAGLGGDEGDAAVGAVDEHRQVELALDLRAVLDIETRDRAA